MECVRFKGEDLIIKTKANKRILPMIKILISKNAS
jgi:hypothetical protein